jgi:hypothetical protein
VIAACWQFLILDVIGPAFEAYMAHPFLGMALIAATCVALYRWTS